MHVGLLSAANGNCLEVILTNERPHSVVIIVRNQDGDILLNSGELKQTSLQRMSAWHHPSKCPIRKSLTSWKYVNVANKGENATSQNLPASKEREVQQNLNSGFPVLGDCLYNCPRIYSQQPIRGLRWCLLTNQRPEWLLTRWRMSSGTQSLQSPTASPRQEAAQYLPKVVKIL